jgi:hypothetical protein
MEAVDAIVSYAQGDILILSPSDFSYASCMLNPGVLKIGMKYAPHWHGCLNHIWVQFETRDLPVVWQNEPWIPESVISSNQQIKVLNVTELLHRIESEIVRVDNKKKAGVYPYSNQIPDFLATHYRHLTRQIDIDITLGLINSTNLRVSKLKQFMDEYHMGHYGDEYYLSY